MQAPPHGHETFRALADVFLRHRGDKRVQFELRVRRQAAGPVLVKADVPQLRVRPSDDLGARRGADLRAGSVVLRCGARAAARSRHARNARIRGTDRDPPEGDRGALDAPQTDVRDGEIDGLRRRIEPDPRRDLHARSRRGSACWWRAIPKRPYMLDYVDGSSPSSSSSTAIAASPTTTRSSAGFARYQRRAGAGLRPPEGPRHEAEDSAELRLRTARGLPQGAARHAAGREVRPADHRLRRHAGGLSRASSPRSAASPRRSP